MNIESRNLRDEASQVYLEQVLVFDEMERLRLARQVLCGIFAVSVGVFAAHAYWEKNEALGQVFELVKIGALPLVTLVVSFLLSQQRGQIRRRVNATSCPPRSSAGGTARRPRTAPARWRSR
ncbi:Uncharacterised protein [Serratia marcescens]|uniref:Uncharacterized protein n=2 Tax=Serratia marcescens TaxID=615 RepID=A0A379Z8C6_SERMA|nr:Uncharacterised protein [Serratia marcescens]